MDSIGLQRAKRLIRQSGCYGWNLIADLPHGPGALPGTVGPLAGGAVHAEWRAFPLSDPLAELGLGELARIFLRKHPNPQNRLGFLGS